MQQKQQKHQQQQQLGVALVSMLCVSTLCHNTMRQKAQKTTRKAAEKNKCFLHVSSATVKVKRQLDKKVKTI